ncbi:unnamed protein product [Penicillium salamii]|uniref:Uncharacterized protein n=1 Tax=Penicillium salamii TaxID=1612424 RepID=A0A9W4IYW3_9EURO|nr:unnamed protein product [Penicillium salamii]
MLTYILQKFGTVYNAEIKHRGDTAIHQSCFYPEHKRKVLAIKVKGKNRIVTCHLFGDGRGTLNIRDREE